ncbi:fatty acyl-AMP ligase [Nonomuraea recticatena]|uniref:Fatty acyl-AMP ligase n=1 Tax=Nonomuraea recticatena TaxID=46178 RepID=A0ABN3TAE0_9ACTN
MTPARRASVLEALLITGAQRGDRPALTVLDRQGTAELSFGDLAHQACQVAARLTELGARGERVLLLCPTSPEYAAIFYGCMLAGAVPVPVFLPSAAHFTAAWPKILPIARDSGAAYAVTPGELPQAERLSALAGFRRCLHTADLLTGPAETGLALPAPDDLAFLQYTSGSTGQPKGVMVTQQGLLHNARAMGGALDADERTTTISWLPLYHDMGIIGALVSPLLWEAHVVLMPSQMFAARPTTWLRAISDYRGQLSYAPNFAYELCASKVTDAELAELDLSSWRRAVCGAEPIRAATIERFAATFAPTGLRLENLRPGYGMAEATLVISMGRWRGRAATTTEVAGRSYLRCGTPVADTTVRIVDLETGLPSAPGEVGEVWISSPSVAAGYWQRPEATAETFHARLPGHQERFLRTGDLGMISDGEIVLVGRHKDLIIINGVNHYPQDIEHTVEQAHPAVRPSMVAAFAAAAAEDQPQAEVAVVVAEVQSSLADDLNQVITDIRLAVAKEHDVRLDGVFLVEPRTIPKTTSGKIQRRASRDGVLAGEFPTLAAWNSPALAGIQLGEAVGA